jgi:hypothetical protein
LAWFRAWDVAQEALVLVGGDLFELKGVVDDARTDDGLG